MIILSIFDNEVMSISNFNLSATFPNIIHSRTLCYKNTIQQIFLAKYSLKLFTVCYYHTKIPLSSKSWKIPQCAQKNYQPTFFFVNM